MTDVAAILSTNLRRIRDASGFTRAQLAELVGISDLMIYNYETGTNFPRAEALNAICKALKIRPWQLLAEEGEGAKCPPEVVELVAATARACGIKVVDPSVGSGHFLPAAIAAANGKRKRKKKTER